MRADSVVELIKELSKLGVFKGKRKAKATAKFEDETKQSSEGMKGYGKTVGPQMRNLPPIQQIPQGATTEQIEDIQQQNALALASLSEEIQRGRITDIQNVGQALFSIVNQQRERFRSQQEPGSGVFNPWQSQSGVFLLPDVQSGDFGKSTSEGAPIARPELPETIFASGEEEPLMQEVLTEEEQARLQPTEKIVSEKTGGGTRTKKAKVSLESARKASQEARKQLIEALLPNNPEPAPQSKIDKIQTFYSLLAGAMNEDEETGLSKPELQAQINILLDKASRVISV